MVTYKEWKQDYDILIQNLQEYIQRKGLESRREKGTELIRGFKELANIAEALKKKPDRGHWEAIINQYDRCQQTAKQMELDMTGERNVFELKRKIVAIMKHIGILAGSWPRWFKKAA